MTSMNQLTKANVTTWRHVLGGTIVLLVMARKAREGSIGPHRMVAVESSATFLHMVDFLWVMIFPLLYLVRWR